MFAADPAVIGTTLLVDGQPATIVGVAPPGFTGFVRGQRADVWMNVSQYFTLGHGPDRLTLRCTATRRGETRTHRGATGRFMRIRLIEEMRRWSRISDGRC